MTNHTAFYSITSDDGTDIKAVQKGDTIKDFRGEDWTFLQVTRPKTPGRDAKVEVQNGEDHREFYAGVFPGLQVD